MTKKNTKKHDLMTKKAIIAIFSSKTIKLTL